VVDGSVTVESSRNMLPVPVHQSMCELAVNNLGHLLGTWRARRNVLRRGVGLQDSYPGCMWLCTRLPGNRHVVHKVIKQVNT